MHALYNNLRYFLRICGAILGFSNAFQHVKSRERSQPTHSSVMGVITYLVEGVDKDLRVAPSEIIDHIGRAPAGADCFDERSSFTLGDSTANQALQSSFTGVEREGWSCWFRGVMSTGSFVIHFTMPEIYGNYQPSLHE